MYAAAVAAAMKPGATADSVIEDALRLAHDGTRDAIEAVCARARNHSSWEAALPDLRDAVAPYDTVGPEYRQPGPEARRPSRARSIEELPVALGLVIIAEGRYEPAVLGAVNYGRDADSIATMAGGITGALGGLAAVPGEWREQVATNSRLDLEATGQTMAEVAAEIFARDEERRASHRSAFTRLSGAT